VRIERVKYDDLDRETGVFGDPDFCGGKRCATNSRSLRAVT
jgi:hypothetical protein